MLPQAFERNFSNTPSLKLKRGTQSEILILKPIVPKSYLASDLIFASVGKIKIELSLAI